MARVGAFAADGAGVGSRAAERDERPPAPHPVGMMAGVRGSRAEVFTEESRKKYGIRGAIRRRP